MIAPTPGRDPGRDRRLHRIAAAAARSRRTPRPTSVCSIASGLRLICSASCDGGRRVDALELVEQRQLLALLLGVLDDLLALARDVGRRDLVLGALGQERSGRHRQRRGDRARQAGGQHGAVAAGRARHAGDDPEHGGQPVVGAVDRAGDPARTGAVPLLASEDLVQPLARARESRSGRRRRGRAATAAAARPTAGRPAGRPRTRRRRRARSWPPPARRSATAIECERSSRRMSRSSRSVVLSPVERL